jgi:hypothetical protein
MGRGAKRRDAFHASPWTDPRRPGPWLLVTKLIRAKSSSSTKAFIARVTFQIVEEHRKFRVEENNVLLRKRAVDNGAPPQ